MVSVCTKCGLCCKNPVIAEVCPWMDRGDGVCKHLQEDNTCEIYDTRPDYCRLDVRYKNDYADKMTLEEFYDQYSKTSCAMLQQHGPELEKQRQLRIWIEKRYKGEVGKEDVPSELSEEVERRVTGRKEFYKWGGDGSKVTKSDCIATLAELGVTFRGKDELLANFQKLKNETHASLQTMYDALNQGQQKKIVKDEAVKALFDRYGVEYTQE